MGPLGPRGLADSREQGVRGKGSGRGSAASNGGGSGGLARRSPQAARVLGEASTGTTPGRSCPARPGSSPLSLALEAFTRGTWQRPPCWGRVSNQASAPSPSPPQGPLSQESTSLCVQTHGPASSTGQEEERKRRGSRPPVHLWQELGNSRPRARPLLQGQSTGDPPIRQGPEGTTNPRVHHNLQKHLICWSLPAPRKTRGTAPHPPPPHARVPRSSGGGAGSSPPHCSRQPGERAGRHPG